MLIRRLLTTLSAKSNKNLPKVAVFDLDHTIWPFGVDTFCFTPPFHYNDKGQVIDMSSKVIEYFPDIVQVFKYLRNNNVQIAVASRTRYPYGARSLLEKLGLHSYIDYFEIYPGQKMKHFKRISQQSGFDYSQMIFFDDENRNIDDISALGVFSVLVSHEKGVTNQEFKQAIDEFKKSRK